MRFIGHLQESALYRNVQQWLAATPFEDDEKHRVSKLFNQILLASMISAILTVALVIPVSTETPGEEILISSIAVLVLALAKSIVHRGYLDRAISIFLVLTWVILTFSIYEFEGGLRGAVIGWYSIHVLVSGLLRGTKAGIISAVCSMSASTILWQAEERGYYIAILDELGAMWAANNVIFVMVAILLHLAVSSIQSALNRARENERHLEARQAELSAANAELEAFLFAIGHDLQEPLRSVRNFGDMLQKRHAAKLDAQGLDYVRRMVGGAERMQTLLQACVLLSQVRQMKGREWISAENIVEASLSQIELACATITLDPNLPKLYVNQRWAIEAIKQLLDNAAKFSLGKPNTEISVHGYCTETTSGLIVRDRGIGLQPDQLHRIFRLFQRGVGRDIVGTGAGLTLVRQIAEHHGGEAWAELREGGGCNFYITFACET